MFFLETLDLEKTKFTNTPAVALTMRRTEEVKNTFRKENKNKRNRRMAPHFFFNGYNTGSIQVWSTTYLCKRLIAKSLFPADLRLLNNILPPPGGRQGCGPDRNGRVLNKPVSLGLGSLENGLTRVNTSANF
jgi:hypothetical protein